MKLSTEQLELAVVTAHNVAKTAATPTATRRKSKPGELGTVITHWTVLWVSANGFEPTITPASRKSFKLLLGMFEPAVIRDIFVNALGDSWFRVHGTPMMLVKNPDQYRTKSKPANPAPTPKRTVFNPEW